MAYIKELTADEYGILDICLISSSVFGESRAESLKCPARGVLTGYTFSILNRRNIPLLGFCLLLNIPYNIIGEMQLYLGQRLAIDLFLLLFIP